MKAQADSTKIYSSFTYDYDDGKKVVDAMGDKTFDFISEYQDDCPLICEFIETDGSNDPLSPEMPDTDPLLEWNVDKQQLVINTAGLYNNGDMKDGFDIKFRLAC